ncbi:MAG: hypothetical protein PCFJNLEI_03425 [Verrucomicrobiae bacterium]|nr:hypothetical protein [Verrucomicrobiae bacterium]
MAHLVPRLIALFTGVVALGSAFATELKSDERVIFFPTIGARAGQEWELAVHGWVFEPESRTVVLPAFRRALGFDGDTLTADEKQIFMERARWFLVDNERGRQIRIQINGTEHQLSKSNPDGHFTDHIRVPVGPVDFPAGALQLWEDTGVTVISDIDDTIKVSEVRDRRALLANTFTRPFRVVPGMPAFYRSLAEQGAQFHYVSASPWQLYPALADFIATAGFPAGSFQMKQFRWKDKTFFDLFDSPEKYKTGVIAPLLARFPRRQFILIGDSGEKDPEIFGALARQFPHQIKRILIRDVTQEPADAPRYQKAFQDLPAKLWLVFEEPPLSL